MNQSDRFSGSESNQEFDAAKFATYAAQPELESLDEQEFTRQREAGLRLARRLLTKNGYRESVSGDLKKTAEDCISELILGLRNVEGRARLVCGTDQLTHPQLFDRIKVLTSASLYRDELLALAEERTDADALELTSGAFILSAICDLWGRLQRELPQDFDKLAQPWTGPRITQVLQLAHSRLRGYTIKALSNGCISKVRAPEYSRTRFLRTSEDQIHVEQEALQRDTRVLSPHVRTVVMRACRSAMEEVECYVASTSLEARNLNYLRALIKSVSLLLDAPGEKLFVLAKDFLPPDYLDPKEFKRGFVAATRHPIYQKLCGQIQEGMSWH